MFKYTTPEKKGISSAAIQRYIEDPVSEQIITDRMQGSRHAGGKIKVGLAKERLTLEWAD